MFSEVSSYDFIFTSIKGTVLAPPAERIFGGSIAEEGQFPHQVSLQHDDHPTKHFCGGSIIGEKWILTAAHCIDLSSTGLDIQTAKVVVGTNKISSGGQPYMISRAIAHEDYDPYSKDYDIALLELKESIKMSDTVKIMPFHSSEQPDGTNCQLSGWELPSYPSAYIPDDLQHINLTIISIKKCKIHIAAVYLSNLNFCASANSGQGACNGDPGSPLISNGRQAGIVSWGIPCVKGKPDVFTSVPRFSSWITDKTGISVAATSNIMGKKTHPIKIKNKRSNSKLSFQQPTSKKKQLLHGKDKSKKKFTLFKGNPMKHKKKNGKLTQDVLSKNIFSHQNKKIVEELYSSQVNEESNAEDWDMVEHEYESLHQHDDKPLAKQRLPIKTASGIIPVVEPILEEELDISDHSDEVVSEEEENVDDDTLEEPKVITAAQLLITQAKTVEAKKIQIGSLSAGILENPEEKIDNLRVLVKLLKEDDVGEFLTLKKIIITSLVEVFKDLLPAYRFNENIDKSVKLKKETLKLNKYETTVLQYYKKFLQYLAYFSSVLIKKRNAAGVTGRKKLLGEVAVNALCDLLQTHPYFNYSENIAQAVVPFLNHLSVTIREKVKLMCKNIFAEDQKGDITLKILRLINQFLKKFSYNIRTDMLEVLLYLKIKDVNIDEDIIQKLKQKKLKSHKGNILKLSKNEKKRAVRVKEVEKALMEAKAEENRQHKQQNMTEITKLTFGMFFKILKNCTNTKIVGICLQGVAKFAHCINIEFYMDLINILGNLLKEDWMGFCEKQQCIQTIFAILCEQGEVINIDPAKFYALMYENLLNIHCGRNYKDFNIIIETLMYSLIKRQKKITNKRMASFLKRVMTLSLQLLHNGTLSCLFISKSLLQSNGKMDILLDLESSWGDGLYLPELKDPEYCNAASTALYELSMLRRHYHPTVVEYAKHIAEGDFSSTDNISNILTRTTPEQLFNTFDMSRMCFYPPVPVLKNVSHKNKRSRIYLNKQFKDSCLKVIKQNKSCLHTYK
ncbi:hypothetical protein FQR65_LT09602 [Abscondita terminalis]|nr:hypothetical protein FQR65_LT09602 [Abscondita terminalis]